MTNCAKAHHKNPDEKNKIDDCNQRTKKRKMERYSMVVDKRPNIVKVSVS